VCDDQGRPVRLHLTAGQVSDFKGADALLSDLPDETEEVIGDTTAIKSDSLSQTGTSPPVFRQRKTGNQSRRTTGICIRSAI
jgi:transposase